MRGRWRKLFLRFLDFVFCYIFGTNLRLFIIFHRDIGASRTLKISGIVLWGCDIS